jgi:hypothetical protein
LAWASRTWLAILAARVGFGFGPWRVQKADRTKHACSMTFVHVKKINDEIDLFESVAL